MEPNDRESPWSSPFINSPDVVERLARELGVNDVTDVESARPRPARGSPVASMPADPWVIALHLAGRLGHAGPGGKYAVWCINDAQHSNPDGSAENAGGSCCLLPPTVGFPYTLPFCSHAHCLDLRKEDWRAAIGDETWATALAMARDARGHDAPADPVSVDVDALVARCIAEEVHAPLFTPEALRAFVALQTAEPLAFEETARKLKAIKGFRLTPWRAALDSIRSTMLREARHARKEREREAAEARRVAREAEKARREAEREAARAAAGGDVADHHARADLDETIYFMEPGRVWAESVLNPGTDRERTVVDTLAGFSALLVEVVMDVDGPDAKPRPAVYVLAVCRATGTPWRIEIAASDWARAEWPEADIAAPGIGPKGRATREHLRAAIEAFSVGRVTTRYRYRHTGWVQHEGRAVYLHAAGAIDADGDVDGLRAEPEIERVKRFALPSLADLDVARDVGAILYLLEHQPAKVWVVLIGLALRAAMGGSRAAAHLTGRSGLGKSVVIGCVSQLFGPSFSARNPVLSWRARGVTVQGMAEVMVAARDVFLQIDDLQRNPESIARITSIIPMHFEGTGQIKGKSRGGALALRGSQCVIGSSGETLPDEPSVRNRVVLLDLDAHPTPQPDEGPDCAKARGDRGELARGMAAFIRWWAARYTESRPRLPQMEREAAAQWGLGVSARAAEVLGPAALGLDAFLDFVHDVEALNEEGIENLRVRLRAALGGATAVHVGHVAEEANWRRYLDLVGQALASSAGHALYGDRHGVVFEIDKPRDPSVWGWRVRTSFSSSGDEERETTSADPSGPTIAYLRSDRPGKVLLAPGASLRVALDLAKRDGRPLQIEVTALARELLDAHIDGLPVLTATSKGRPIGRAKWSWGSTDVDGFEVSVSAINRAATSDADDSDSVNVPVE
jgi:hypothetical protein